MESSPLFKVQIFWEGWKNLKISPNFIWRWLVRSKIVFRFFQIFVAFSEHLTFLSEHQKMSAWLSSKLCRNFKLYLHSILDVNIWENENSYLGKYRLAKTYRVNKNQIRLAKMLGHIRSPRMEVCTSNQK